MDKNEAIKIIRSNFPTGRKMLCEALEILIPELKESEDERIRKAIVNHLLELSKSRVNLMTKETYENWIAWLEKQNEFIDKEKVLIGARKGIAISIMNFLDRNTLGMCLSNMECKDLEDAVVNSDWSKVYNYMKKKLEKQGEQKSAWNEGEEDEPILMNLLLS